MILVMVILILPFTLFYVDELVNEKGPCKTAISALI